MYDVVTFGEAMVRLSPPHFQRLEQTVSLDVQVGGGELNVAVGVRRLGLSSAWVSRLPQNALGRMVDNRARQAGVDTSHVAWPKRAGRVCILLNLARRHVPAPCSMIERIRPSAPIRPAKLIGRKYLPEPSVPYQRHHAGAERCRRRSHA